MDGFAQLRELLSLGEDWSVARKHRRLSALFGAWPREDGEREAGLSYVESYWGVTEASLSAFAKLEALLDGGVGEDVSGRREELLVMLEVWESEGTAFVEDAYAYALTCWGATRDSFHLLQPMPARSRLVPYEREFSSREVMGMRFGRIPQSMDDRWAVFEEELRFFFHRSWTGYCIYALDLTLSPDGSGISRKLRVNGDEAQYRAGSDEEEAGRLDWLLGLVLGVKVASGDGGAMA